MKKRTCTICKNEYPLSSTHFHKDSSRPSGFVFNCKSCEKKRGREKYLKNPRVDRYKLMTDEQKKERLLWAGKYRKTPKGRAIFYLKAYQTIDKKRGLQTDLDQEYLINSFKMPCIYCGHESMGVDRIDNRIGHTKDNCKPCCKECNVARMDNFTHEEMFEIGKAIKKIKDARAKLKSQINI
jgi:transcription elongation factor Elf1